MRLLVLSSVDLFEPDETGSEIKLSRIVAGDVLPTVSRRDSRRSKANVWTSANRVFSAIDQMSWSPR